MWYLQESGAPWIAGKERFKSESIVERFTLTCRHHTSHHIVTIEGKNAETEMEMYIIVACHRHPRHGRNYYQSRSPVLRLHVLFELPLVNGRSS